MSLKGSRPLGDKWRDMPAADGNCLLLPASSLFSSSRLFKHAVLGFMLRSTGEREESEREREAASQSESQGTGTEGQGMQGERRDGKRGDEGRTGGCLRVAASTAVQSSREERHSKPDARPRTLAD